MQSPKLLSTPVTDVIEMNNKVYFRANLYSFIDESRNLVTVDLVSGDILNKKTDIINNISKGVIEACNSYEGKIYLYSEDMKNIIYALMCEGNSLTKISQMPGMPTMSTIARWRHEYHEFESLIRRAKKVRAELYADLIHDSLTDMREIDSRQVSGERLWFDKVKYLAEKNDPDTYGSRQMLVGDRTAPVSFLIDTGVRDADDYKAAGVDSNYIEVIPDETIVNTEECE